MIPTKTSTEIENIEDIKCINEFTFQFNLEFTHLGSIELPQVDHHGFHDDSKPNTRGVTVPKMLHMLK